MEISASSRLDLRTLRAVNALALFGKKDPRKSLWRRTILIAVCASILLLSELLMLALGDSLPPWMFIVMGVCVLLTLFMLYLYYIAPKRQYKKLGKQANVENHYFFHEQDMRITAEGANGFHSEETIPYSMLHALKETTAYFFVYLDKIHIVPVDKRTLSATEIDTVRTWLSAVLPYTLCHY